MPLHNDVFNQQIWGWFCNDLESCLAVAKKSRDGEFKGGLNFPACLTTFSVIEMASGYLSGNEHDKRVMDRVVTFLTTYFSNHDSRFGDPDFSRGFHDVFRNGLSHQWAPKGGGVGMDIGADLIIWHNGDLAVEAPAFFDLTKLALKDYESDLNQDSSLRTKFKQRHKWMSDTDRDRMEELKAILPYPTRPDQTIA